MADTAQHHRQVEAHLNALARRHFPPGSFHLSLADVAKLGHGDLAIGEDILARMFHLVGPRSVSPAALRQLGNGNAAVGVRVVKAISRPLA